MLHAIHNPFRKTTVRGIDDCCRVQTQLKSMCMLSQVFRPVPEMTHFFINHFGTDL